MSVNNCKTGKKIGFIGAGKMASAIMGGVVKSGFADAKNIFVYDVNDAAMDAASKNFGINIQKDIPSLIKNVDVVLIATKPFVVNDVLLLMKDAIDNQLVISILAGVKTSKIEAQLNNARVVRVMPNTPAFVKEGMCGICKGANATNEDINFVNSMLKNIGKTVIVDESQIDIVTAVSGSGPAFYYYITDLIARAGEKLGLDYKTCLTLSAQTALGSAKMILENIDGGQTPKELIDAVTTPGGCTAEGNKVLENSDLEQILDKTIKDTMQKAIELG